MNERLVTPSSPSRTINHLWWSKAGYQGQRRVTVGKSHCQNRRQKWLRIQVKLEQAHGPQLAFLLANSLPKSNILMLSAAG